MVTGVNHIALAVRDLAESYEFYVEVLGCRPVARWPEGAYLLAGSMWIGLVKDSETGEKPLPEYTHICFDVSMEDFEPLSRKIRQTGVEIWQENKTEGASLYFLDPTGHKLEIHASDLPTRLEHARKHPWNGLELFV